MPLDDPGAVVGSLEPLHCQAELLDRLEAPQPQQVLLERTDEPLGAAVALGLADEGLRALHAEEGDLHLEGCTSRGLLGPHVQKRGAKFARPLARPPPPGFVASRDSSASTASRRR